MFGVFGCLRYCQFQRPEKTGWTKSRDLFQAIIHYIQMIEKESRERAEEIYLDYRQHTDDEDVEDVKNYLKRKKVDEATREETLQRAKSLLT